MYHSYKHLFKIKWKIYSIGNKPLPRALPIDVPAIFVLFLPPSMFLALLFEKILDQPYWGLVFLLSGLFTFFAKKYDPQGRFILTFIYDFLYFLLRPRKTDFSGKPIQKHRKVYAYWDAMDLE